jgi:hypothetical protein
VAEEIAPGCCENPLYRPIQAVPEDPRVMKKQIMTLSGVREVHGSDFTEAILGPKFVRKHPMFSFTFACGAMAQGQGADSLTMEEKCAIHKARPSSRTRAKVKV